MCSNQNFRHTTEQFFSVLYYEIMHQDSRTVVVISFELKTEYFRDYRYITLAEYLQELDRVFLFLTIQVTTENSTDISNHITNTVDARVSSSQNIRHTF